MKKAISLKVLIVTIASASIVPFQEQVSAGEATQLSGSVRQNVINPGMKYLGTPYEFGSS
jgi:cell wall-associated NlpC family hydrolase